MGMPVVLVFGSQVYFVFEFCVCFCFCFGVLVSWFFFVLEGGELSRASVSVISLHGCTAMSGTDLRYAPTRRQDEHRVQALEEGTFRDWEVPNQFPFRYRLYAEVGVCH